MARKRLTKSYFREQGSAGGRKAWADMSAEERSQEMKRRAAKRKRNKAKRPK